MSETVSVVTPSFNQGAFLEKTITSVLSQEGDFHLDYIVVDGGSTDGSQEQIRRYDDLLRAGQVETRCNGVRYRWVSEPDEGQSDAINKGFRMSDGDVVAWLNSDDSYEPGAIRTALDALAHDPDLTFVYGDCRFVDDQGTELFVKRGPRTYRSPGFVQGTQGLSQPTVFVRRGAFEAAGLLDPRLYYTMDQDWFRRMARRRRVQYVPFVFATACIHGAAKTRDRLHPPYCAESVLVAYRHGGARAAARVLGCIAAERARADDSSVQDAFSPLQQAIDAKAPELDCALPARVLAKARAVACLALALETANTDRAGAARHLAAAWRCDPLCALHGRSLLGLAKTLLPHSVYSRLRSAARGA